MHAARTAPIQYWVQLAWHAVPHVFTADHSKASTYCPALRGSAGAA